jgi:hypothetical protein
MAGEVPQHDGYWHDQQQAMHMLLPVANEKVVGPFDIGPDAEADAVGIHQVQPEGMVVKQRDGDGDHAIEHHHFQAAQAQCRG